MIGEVGIRTEEEMGIGIPTETGATSKVLVSATVVMGFGREADTLLVVAVLVLVLVGDE